MDLTDSGNMSHNVKTEVQTTKMTGAKRTFRKWTFKLTAACMLVFIAHSVGAQHEIRFTGKDNTGGYVQLHHIVVENATQGWQDTLFYPDTTLLLSPVGIETHLKPGTISLSQNSPNPFSGVTDFSLTLSMATPLNIEVVDLSGRKVADLSQQLTTGSHAFRVWLNAPQPYLLNVLTPQDRASIKMLNLSSGGDNRIAYLGETKAAKSAFRDTHPYSTGDLMRIVGYTLFDNGNVLPSETLEQSLDASCTITLTFNIVSNISVQTGNCLWTTHHEAVCEGNVTSDGLLPVTARGICWNTSGNPVISDPHTDAGAGTGDFLSTLSNLLAGTTYHYRAYASNPTGTFYGNDAVLTTMSNSAPTVNTGSVTNNAGYTATCSGTIVDDGGSPILEKGICWGQNHNPTISDSHVASTDTGLTFTGSMTGLSLNTYYYVRAYATNSIGTSYGDNVQFRTAYLLTTHIISLSDTTNVSISATGRISNASPSYSAKGFCWGTSPNPTLSDQSITNNSALTGIGNFTSTITGLTPGTTYYVRAFVTNNVGTSYSPEQKVFTTKSLPIITTDSVIAVADSSVLTGGDILHNGSLPITSAGVCWSTSPNPTYNDRHIAVGDTLGHFQVPLAGLSPDSIYYLRAYATNSSGTSYGEEFTFRARVHYGQTCPGNPTVADYDGNVYQTVQIGLQCWMAENLRTSHFADGTFIPMGVVGDESNFTYYRYYPNGDSTIVNVYGYHYNWKTAMYGAGSSNSNPSNRQGVCPIGWHLPSRAEWQEMKTYVGSQSQYCCSSSSESIGKSLASISGWQESNYSCSVGNLQAANNETGFNAYPAGGMYMRFGQDAGFWSATAPYSTAYGGYAYIFTLGSASSTLSELDQEQWYQWHSVRCVKD